MAVNEERLNAFLGKAIVDLGAAISAVLILVGDELGLYRALAKSPATPQELADLPHRQRIGLLLHDQPYQPINLTNSAQAVTRAIANMLPGGASTTTRNALLAYAASPQVLGSSAVLADRTKLRVGLGLLIAAVAATPEFQFRG